MSKCVILGDAIDETETEAKTIANDIVDFILEETVLVAALYSYKDCNLIGDFSITEDFCQQFDLVSPHSKDIDTSKLNLSQNPELQLESGESVERTIGLLAARENLEFVLESVLKKDDDSAKSLNDCKLIGSEILRNNEVQIENGFTHAEQTVGDEKITNIQRSADKGEASYLNQIHELSNNDHDSTRAIKKIDEPALKGNPKSSFAWRLHEELKQVNCQLEYQTADESIVPKQSNEMLRFVEELSSAQVLLQATTDPNRPRACAFAEDEVKKMAKEIEEMNFNQYHVNSNASSATYKSDEKGNATKKVPLQSEEKVFNNVVENRDFSDSNSFTLLNAVPSAGTPQQNESDGINKINSQVLNKIDQLVMGSRKAECQLPFDINELQYSNIMISSANITDRHLLNATNFISEANLTESDFYSKNTDSSSLVVEFNDTQDKYSVDVKIDSGDPEDTAKAFLKSENHITEVSDDISFPKEKFREKITFSHGTEYRFSKPEESKSLGQIFSSHLKFENEVAKTCSHIQKFGISKEYEETEERQACILQNSTTEASSARAFGQSEKETFFTVDGDRSSVPLQSSIGMKESVSKCRSGNRNIEVALSDSRLSEENKFHCLKGTQSATFSAVITQADSHCLARVETDNVNDGFFSLEKKVEASSLQSNIFDLPSESVKTKFSQSKTECFDLTPPTHVIPGKIENDACAIQNIISYNPQSEIFSESRVQDTLTMSGSLLSVVVEKSSEYQQNLEAEITFNEHEHNATYNFTEKYPVATSAEKGKTRGLSDDHTQQEGISEEGISTDEPDAKQEEKYFTDCGLFEPTQSFMNESQQSRQTDYFDKECVMSSSVQENFIDVMENVIQIINPGDNGSDAKTVSFSLPEECGAQEDRETRETFDVENVSTFIDGKEPKSVAECLFGKQTLSGMSTIGPIKNINYDPKDLTCDVDYGKMSYVTVAIKAPVEPALTRNVNKFSLSRKESNESNSDSLALVEETPLETEAFVNRDIASLTKVQKIREVMSYQPKPEEDFNDETNLNRSRLDLKDVESIMDGRFRLPDINIPLLPFEVGDVASDIDGCLVQNVRLITSKNSFKEEKYFSPDDLTEGANEEKNKECFLQLTVSKDSEHFESDAFNTSVSDDRISVHVDVNEKNVPIAENSMTFIASDANLKKSSAANMQDNELLNPKFGTLGAVFRKASNKLVQKDHDFYLRSSKSLPRDSNKLEASESIKSILQDCHSSAANILRKSRSLFRNTQNVIVSFSQSQLGNVATSSSDIRSQKFFPTERDIKNARSKLFFSSKEDFSKVKNIIKSKLGKPFNVTENITKRKCLDLSKNQSENLLNKQEANEEEKDEKKEIREKNDKPAENESKSPVIIESLCEKIGSNVDQYPALKVVAIATPENNEYPADSSTLSFQMRSDNKDEERDPTQKKSPEIEDFSLGITEKESTFRRAGSNCQDRLPEYIQMETVEGLTQREMENLRYSIRQKPSDSFLPEKHEEAGVKVTRNEGAKEAKMENESLISPSTLNESNDSSAIKSKKLTTRLRNFWSTTIGKVKTSSKRENL